MAILLEQDYHFHDTGSRFNSADTRSSHRTLHGWLIADLRFGVRHNSNKPPLEELPFARPGFGAPVSSLLILQEAKCRPPNVDFDLFAFYAETAELDAAFCVALLPSL